jgi:hypothetical protein
VNKLTATAESTGLLLRYKLANSLVELCEAFRARTAFELRLARFGKMDDWDNVAPPQPDLDDDLYVSDLHQHLHNF